MYATIRLIKQNDTIQVDVIDNNYLTALELMKERADGESIGFFIENIEEHEAVKRTLNAITCGTANFIGDSIGYVDSEFQVFMTPEPAYGIEVLKPKRENGGFKNPDVYEPSDQIFHDVPSPSRSRLDRLTAIITESVNSAKSHEKAAPVKPKKKNVYNTKGQKRKKASTPQITKDGAGKIIKIVTKTFSTITDLSDYDTSGQPF